MLKHIVFFLQKNYSGFERPPAQKASGQEGGEINVRSIIVRASCDTRWYRS
jgi:hypothetical protein